MESFSNDGHGTNLVQSGALSALRQSISSLVAGGRSDKAATNRLIDLLSVEEDIKQK